MAASRRLRQQFRFSKAIGELIIFAYAAGYTISFGDAWAKDGHISGSFHYKRLAIDFNLFKDDVWLTKTSDHKEIGAAWVRLGGTWGGNFNRPDGNHYSWGEGKR